MFKFHNNDLSQHLSAVHLLCLPFAAYYGVTATLNIKYFIDKNKKRSLTKLHHLLRNLYLLLNGSENEDNDLNEMLSLACGMRSIQIMGYRKHGFIIIIIIITWLHSPS